MPTASSMPTPPERASLENPPVAGGGLRAAREAALPPGAALPATVAATLPPADVLTRLGASPSGLTATEAADRLEAGGPNAVRTHHAQALHVLARQLRSAILLLLSHAVPHRLLHRVAGHADAGDLRDPHATEPVLAQPTRRCAHRGCAGRRGRRCGTAVLTAVCSARFHRPAGAVPARRAADGAVLPGAGRGRQAALLRRASRGRPPSYAVVAAPIGCAGGPPPSATGVGWRTRRGPASAGDLRPCGVPGGTARVGRAGGNRSRRERWAHRWT
jgi:hypothetical protein